MYIYSEILFTIFNNLNTFFSLILFFLLYLCIEFEGKGNKKSVKFIYNF
jgi:hypothetical protein